MSQKIIHFLRLTHLRGPNIWTYRPVIEAWVDIGDLEDCPSNTLPGFVDRLVTWLPGLAAHRCGIGEPGGFVLRLRDGTWPGHIMEHVALELQTLAGMQTGFGKARQTHQRGIYKVVIRTRHEAVGRAAIEGARDLVMAAIENRPFDVAATVGRLKQMVDTLCLGPSTACMVDAAAERGIPSIRLNDGNLVQLGHGASQRRIWTAETDRTSAIAEGISRDKELTKQLLASCGVPVPEGRTVRNPQEAWDIAQDIGLPVAVKPTDGNHGRGVSLDLNTSAEVEAAFPIAAAEGSEVMVERYIPGEEHRLLVVGNQVVAAARGEIATIRGDGRSTVAALIETQINSDPRRGEEEDYPLDTIRLGDNPTAVLELQRQGLTAESIPAEGRVVMVLRNGNMCNDVTDQVHPDVAEQVALAARIVGLDIAGVDLVARDISRPLHEQGGAIVEVNAGPGLLMHLKPAIGEPQPVGQAIVRHLFGPSDTGRIPLVGIVGSSGTTRAARLMAWLLHLSGRHTGLACSDGLFLDQRQLESGNAMGWESGQRLLVNRAVQAAVVESSAYHILAEGLPYDRCQVGVVTGMPSAVGLDAFYIHEDGQMPNIIRTQVDVVLDHGAAVLNADDPAVADLASYCDGEVIFYGLDETAPALARHRAEGGRALFLRGKTLMLATGDHAVVLLDLSMPALARLSGALGISPGEILPAVGAAWALDIFPDLIRAGLKSYGQRPAVN
jgi:cyanophycin synthetase